MTKYKIVGIVNLLLGLVGIIIQLNTLLFIYPKLFSLYKDFNAELPLSTQTYPYIQIAIMLILAVIAFVGVKLILSKNPNKKLFVAGLISLIVILLLIFLNYISFLSGLVTPLYNLKSTF